ncbi:ABC transporter ATP-binding protein [Domibacillus sp. DTU_2020_1001157_1_SI_ALB_TIR_016]|uniref:ABC transporter ATP-binding protein n=1 Tax=Domibacillus sp. DTU_2020_1001157_1_SI_ALB_TIR_016 TaxID=3077789 RepID=UPI0028F0816F|nr:ABC transporter ATP-binding protein [Domibacillus sp. DTU_2020_1001157_1_SI_ALB_TIR_016]WNS78461.1 ABC transporter ATP-binding protein [Domibacillus sp. DTU_2020_1001157_1_SI_ALB_TIR_016]
MEILTIKNADFMYQGKQAVISDVNLDITKGEFHCLLGKSGCGKTTLLKLASGLLQPDKGIIQLDGKELDGPYQECGFMFQSPTLLEWKTVMDNVLLPIFLKRKVTEEDRKHAASLLDMVGLSEHHNRYPAQLSGGQQSRVSLARALIQHPSMLFLDEPFAALDAITREELQEDLLRICQLHQTTVLFITHDISEAVYLSDRISVMDRGRIICEEKVLLKKPRLINMRYEPYFNHLCLTLRQKMSEGRP